MSSKIISLEYSFNPVSNQAFLSVQSDIFEPAFKKLGFEARDYPRGDFENFNGLRGYLVRGIGVDQEVNFNKGNQTYHLVTQRVGNAHILIKTHDDGKPIVNISHLRLVGTKEGKRFEVFPINAAKVKPVLNSYSEGAIHYYKQLKKYIENMSKFSKK